MGRLVQVQRVLAGSGATWQTGLNDGWTVNRLTCNRWASGTRQDKAVSTVRQRYIPVKFNRSGVRAVPD